ncbi:uncharacterized protein LOC124147322 isoform X2 [Haliotis rufescens]|uniref:uncharacterized protein LOC124147322 isoform X2 n=1 Tax=Haliotis rufescens TaxID=6454 RepID=UPI001EB05941|nr:uncharacterized protein LOC124147322 isoform X2 [Haliotis rufescens]
MHVTTRATIGKNLPACAEDTLVNFLEVICDNGVEAIDYFDDRVKHIALVTMEEDIEDARRCQDKASRRQVDGHQIDLVDVGAAVGVVVKGLPEHVTEEALRSYFESSESGGRHGVVEECRIYTTSHAATVVINDADALQSILRKGSHGVVGNEPPVTATPFYQEFHKEVLGYLEGLQEEQGEINHQ